MSFTEAEAGSLVPAAGIDKYDLIAELARGGMGVVYLAVLRGPAGFNKLLVVKELRGELLDDTMAVTMFLDEARLAARLNHPNIVQTIEVGSEGRRRFIAMEFLDGQPLQRVLSRAKRLGHEMPLDMRVRVIADVLEALEYAHSLADFDGKPLRVVHRDVSPQNVLVTYEGHVKLVDFGIAKTADATQHTRGGLLKGKMRYMAPEQVGGEKIDRRADLFAVGVMLWEAVAGRRTWEGKADGAILRSLMAGEIPRVVDARPDADADLVAVVERATHVDPEARYPTARAMRDDLERWTASRGGGPASTRSLAEFTTQLFSEDREQLKGLIEAQLRTLREQESTRVPSSGAPVALAMSLPVRADLDPDVAPEDPISSWRTSGGPTQGLAVSTPASVPPPASSRPRAASVAGVAAVVGAAVAVLVGYAWRTSSDSASRAPAVAPAVGAAMVVAPASAHLIVRVTPSSARLFVDDEPVGNPYAVERPRDGSTHRWRADAPGYEGRSSTFSFDKDIELEIALDREAPAARPPAAKTGPAPAATQPAAPADSSASDAPPTSRKREIDKDNPYAP
ncbi:MAG TPA: serine/threonine-protein kinase [Polyangiaceae bacterium]|nr:serine/threonine-protein kinase [Polyangiaceae bacterium]